MLRCDPVRPHPGCLERAVDRWIDGDDLAFSEIYRALAPRVRGLLARLTRDGALAEDLTQETFARMHQARGECRRGVDLAPWAYTIARHVLCDHARRARLRRFAAGEADGYSRVLGAAHAPDEELTARRLASSIEALIADLPEGQARAFRLVRDEGHALKDAATHLGRTEMAVRLSVHRARSAIRRHLAEHWDIQAPHAAP